MVNLEDYQMVDGFIFNYDPKIVVVSLKGKWLLERCHMSWRKDNLIKGFQRKLNEKRLRDMASKVLDNNRPYPNAIILSSKIDPFINNENGFYVNNNSYFLIIDGQHRLISQKYSDYDADYLCIIHINLTEREMAFLFKEINDNQKRVPSSLRWDLIRLIEPDQTLNKRKAVDIIFELVNEEMDSPLYQRVDLTGENNNIELKQASIAVEVEKLLRTKGKFSSIRDFELQKDILKYYFISMKDLDLKAWNDGNSIFNRNRVMRAALQCLNLILLKIDKPEKEILPNDISIFLNKLNISNYITQNIKSIQGDAGIASLRTQMIIEMELD